MNVLMISAKFRDHTRIFAPDLPTGSPRKPGNGFSKPVTLNRMSESVIEVNPHKGAMKKFNGFFRRSMERNVLQEGAGVSCGPIIPFPRMRTDFQNP